MKVQDILQIDHIFFYPSLSTPQELYEQFTTDLKNQSIIENDKLIRRLFIKREGLQSTAIGKGAATPHIYSNEFKEFFLAVAISSSGIDYITPDKNPVHMVFIIMSDERYVSKHLKTLSLIAKLVDQTDVVERIKNLDKKEVIYNTLVHLGEKIN